MDPFPLVLLALLVGIIAVSGFVAVRARRRRLPPPELEPLEEAHLPGEAPAEPVAPETTHEAMPTETAPQPTASPPAPAVEAPAAPPAREEIPRVSRLSRGLAKTRSALGRTLSVLTFGERLDDEDWEDVEAALISADVGVKAATRIIESLRKAGPTPSSLPEALKAELLAVLSDSDRRLRTQSAGKPAVWLVTGVNGAGKTTTIAKLAHRMRSQGHSVVLAAADTFRAAAIDQLGTWAERTGVHMVRHAPGADPGAVVYDAIEHARAKGVDLVIADTAGRLHTKSNLMEELKKVHRIASQQAGGIAEVLLVLDATVGQNGIAQARKFKEAVGVTGLVLAKLDGSAKGGVVLAVEEELGIPVKVVGIGEGLDDLETFDPRDFVEGLLHAA